MDFPMFKQEYHKPGIELLPELHPHEPNAPEIISSALRSFRFHDEFRRICYDSASGNVLTPGALKRCSATFFRGGEHEMRLFFAPGGTRFDSFLLSGLENLAGSFLESAVQQEKEP